MCWNASVSLNTFVLSVFAIMFATTNKVIVPVKAFYYLLFVSMQLVEYFTWKHMKDRNMNRILSQIGLVIIILLPLGGMLAFFKRTPTWLLGAYLLFVLVMLSIHSINYSMTRASNGHLAWNWLRFPSWVVMVYFLFWLSPYLIQQNWTLVAIHSTLFLTVYYTYLKTDTWGSMWCWISNFFSLLLILKVFQKDLCSF